MMRVRLPLYAKILLWFFLNLLLIAGVFALLFYTQFQFDLDWMLASRARDRVQTTSALIMGDLNTSTPESWPYILKRFSDAYGVRFSVYDDDGTHLVGEVAEVPDEVRARIIRPPRRDHGPPPPGTTPAQRRGLPALIRTSDPARYWLLMSARLDNPQFDDPTRVVIVGVSRSLSSGGIVFDPTPLLGLGLATIFCSMLFWLPLVGGMSRAIGKITNATTQIAHGRFDVRVNERRRDEIGSLGHAINQMAARLDGFVHGQKRFLGDIAHELCAPVAKLQLALGILEARAEVSQRKYVDAACEKAAQISDLVNELLQFSKASFGPAAVNLQSVKLRAAVVEAAQREGAEIELDVPEDLTVRADHDLLVRAVANLLRNAARHAPGAAVSIEALVADDVVNLRVADTGPGVPEEQLAQIFDAFYRIDASRNRETGGVGLGLTIVRTCVESCGGTVIAQNCEPHGLEIVIQLSEARASMPVADAPTAAETSSSLPG